MSIRTAFGFEISAEYIGTTVRWVAVGVFSVSLFDIARYTSIVFKSWSTCILNW
jgi:hypothetical protein